MITKQSLKCLVGVGKTSHTTHYTKNVVVGGVDTYLSGFLAGYSSGRNNESRIV